MWPSWPSWLAPLTSLMAVLVAADATTTGLSGLLLQQTKHPDDKVLPSKTPPEESAELLSRILESLLQLLPAQDDNVTSSDLLREMGFNSETHFVTTKDGYKLRLDRIPNQGRPPVFLAHGMQTSSPSFLLLGRGRALGIMLYEAGYDVWMINYRGAHYSQEHTHYSRYDSDYWKFSWHEHGVYDNPAAIDYILQETGFPDVLYVGHSMGSTSFLVMASERPETQRMVRAAFLMAPVGPMHHHRSLLVQILHTVHKLIQTAMDRLKLHAVMVPLYRILRRAGRSLCSLAPSFCYALTSAITGPVARGDYYSLPYWWNTIPSGGSWNEISHYCQNSGPHEKGFRKFDHGRKRNLELYGSAVPPEYKISDIGTPVALYLAPKDALSTLKDGEIIETQLPNVLQMRVASDPTFNHLDFIAAKRAPKEVYALLVKDVNKFLKDQSDKRNVQRMRTAVDQR